MARLSADQWAEIRSQWEASPKQGLAWLVRKEGGPWDVTEEAVRMRRAREGWAKRGALGDLAEKAHLVADGPRLGPGPDPELGVGQLGPSDSGASSGPGEASEGAELGSGDATEKSAVEQRAELIQKHRDEWRASRALLYRSMKIARTSTGFEAAKFAKISAETLALIQAGERKAWGLDAAQADLKQLSDEELERIASGRMPV
jgi:hypothetical protein